MFNFSIDFFVDICEKSLKSGKIHENFKNLSKNINEKLNNRIKVRRPDKDCKISAKLKN